jgi:monoamine oxidase
MSTWYGSPVVVGLAVGDSARALAAMDEDAKVRSLHQVIEVIGGADTPLPHHHAVTSWTNDPFLLGCYTNVSPNRTIGEHTDDAGTSTVDSAWRSGLREAARLLRTDRLNL